MTDRRVVVVDGSNLATEGRTTPSLQQLDEAVRAYVVEDPDAEIVVVVDASFEHRVDASERAALEEAELHGEVVSPPAGAIGRGDAFVLRIAERTSASVLSNDSFQEFHGEHPWLFDEGRLIGGKPVPGVGWIFTPRIPVRGPKSRQATGRARRSAAAETLTPPAKAAELVKAARKAAAKRMAVLPDGSRPKVGDVWQKSPPAPTTATPTTAALADRSVQVDNGAALGVASEEPPGADHGRSPAERSARARGRKATAETSAAPAKKAAQKAAEKAAAGDAAASPGTTKGAATKAAKAAKATKVAKAAKAGGAKKAAARSGRRGAHDGEGEAPAGATDAQGTGSAAPSTRRTRARDVPTLRDAIDEATAEALAPPPPEATAAPPAVDAGDDGEDGKDGRGRRRRRRTVATPPAVNEPLDFITFVAAFPLGSELEGEVVSFTSHGAMVDVDLPEGGTLHCYIPLAAMADPPPTKARQVLSRGERRTFVLVGLDPPRRVAELALPGVPAGSLEPAAATI